MKHISTRLAKVRDPRLVGALLTLAALLLLAGVVLAAGPPELVKWVIGGGGGHAETPPYALDGTVGQAVVGVVSNAPYELCAGFWCGLPAKYRAYLPLVMRGAK